jgi:hypothetical protein
MELLTGKPKLRFRPIVFFSACVLVLAAASYFKPQPYRALYGGLAGLLIFAMAYQYRKETRLLGNHLSAVAVITDYRLRGKHAPYFGGGVPIIHYEFLAFDQKTYRGETGWGAKGLHVGSYITVLYNPENPTRSHPLRGFVFYSFT